MTRQSVSKGSAPSSAYTIINAIIWLVYVALVLLVVQVLAFADPGRGDGIRAGHRGGTASATARRCTGGPATVQPPVAARTSRHAGSRPACANPLMGLPRRPGQRRK